MLQVCLRGESCSNYEVNALFYLICVAMSPADLFLARCKQRWDLSAGKGFRGSAQRFSR